MSARLHHTDDAKGSTDMHARPPAQNVILQRRESKHVIQCIKQKRSAPACTHKFEYTPGIFASSTVSGSGVSHRSGFHSAASGPHIAGFLLDELMLTKTCVSLGTKISCMSVPSSPRIGCESGRTTSLRAL